MGTDFQMFTQRSMGTVKNGFKKEMYSLLHTLRIRSYLDTRVDIWRSLFSQISHPSIYCSRIPNTTRITGHLKLEGIKGCQEEAHMPWLL